MSRDNVYEFYREMLDPEKKQVYDAMAEGLLGLEDSFRITGCSLDTIHEMHEKVRMDHPEIFYIKLLNIQTSRKTREHQIRPQYRFTKDVIRKISDDAVKRTADVIRECSGKSDVSREQFIHDYLVKIATYKDREAPYSHEMPGVFLYGIGVCEGISKAFKYLCDRVQLKSGIAVGTTKKQNGAHGWNMIRLDGEWYHVDVTYDASLSKRVDGIRYDYFNVSDRELTDRCTRLPVPKCNSYYGFYERRKMFASSKRDFCRMVSSRTGEKISVKLPRLDCSENQLTEYLMNAVSETMPRNESYRILITPNYDMNVFTISVTNR